MGRRSPTKTPDTSVRVRNPFSALSDTSGEESRSGGTQPPAAPAPTKAEYQPVTKIIVTGQPRETIRAYGHVLTERGWTKEHDTDG